MSDKNLYIFKNGEYQRVVTGDDSSLAHEVIEIPDGSQEIDLSSLSKFTFVEFKNTTNHYSGSYTVQLPSFVKIVINNCTAELFGVSVDTVPNNFFSMSVQQGTNLVTEEELLDGDGGSLFRILIQDNFAIISDHDQN